MALRLIVNREAEIEQFEPEEYWSVTAALAALHGGSFQARLSCFDGTKVKELDVFNEATARSVCDISIDSAGNGLSIGQGPGTCDVSTCA